jgi:N-acetylmuramoyl-L-alanine amidase
MRPLLAVLLVLMVACVPSSALGPPDTTLPASLDPTTTTLASTTTLVITTTTTDDPGASFEEMAADGLVTPNGVVVAVLEQTTSGYLVRTPCGNEEVVSSGTPIAGVSVVVDPGHGGEVDTGAVGANGLTEKNLNLTLAQALEAKLIVRGVSVILTRTGHYASLLGTRTALADHLGADLLLSVHHNAPTPGASSQPGTEIFIQHDSAESRRLGGLVWQHVVQALSQFDVSWSAAPDAGVLSVLSTRGNDAYGINRSPETPSVLAELGYLSNPAEAELFATDEYVEAAAEALADAVGTYLNTDDPGSGFIAEPRVFNPQPGIGSSLCVDPALE